MSKTVFQVIRRPIITEKGLGVKETQRTLVFEVAAGATKTEIAQAVERIFNKDPKKLEVKVEAVRTANFFGKFRRRGRSEGYRRDWKKAYVKLTKDSKTVEFAENL